jgi:tetratricopeptide (TPR) repeat protein
MYLAVGGKRQELNTCLEQAKKSIERATELDPQNAAYLLFEGNVAFIHSYMATHKGGEEAKEKVGNFCKVLKRVIKAKPDLLAPMLHLVEIYGTLPAENGGDKGLAQEYAKKLEERDEIFGAKARSILLPEDADKVAYWENILSQHPGNAEVLEELGKSCLYSERFAEGIGYLHEAIEADPRKKVLLLDLARCHVYRVMNGDGPKGQLLAAAEKEARRYLDTEPIPPMRAYTMAIMARIKYGLDDKQAAADFRKEAAKIDPNYSKASGLPGQDLFLPPDKVPTEHRYLYRPF